MSDSEGNPEEEDESVDFDFLESAEGQITTLRPTPFEPQVEEIFDDVGALSGFNVTFPVFLNNLILVDWSNLSKT